MIPLAFVCQLFSNAECICETLAHLADGNRLLTEQLVKFMEEKLAKEAKRERKRFSVFQRNRKRTILAKQKSNKRLIERSRVEDEHRYRNQKENFSDDLL